MSTYTQIYYHIVFSTKHRHPVLLKDRRRDLFAYIWGILKNKECHLYRINGTEDHLHIFTSLHSTVALADFIRDMKTSSSSWIKDNNVFPDFRHWQDGYGAFTKSHAEKNATIEYIRHQEEHHQTESYLDELRRLLGKEGVEFEERFLG